jgi:hypothetical protein
VSVQNEITEAIALVNLGVYSDSAFVPKLAAELDIVERDSVVCRLCPVGSAVSLYLLKACWNPIELEEQHTKLGGCLGLKPCLQNYLSPHSDRISFGGRRNLVD